MKNTTKHTIAALTLSGLMTVQTMTNIELFNSNKEAEETQEKLLKELNETNKNLKDLKEENNKTLKAKQEQDKAYEELKKKVEEQAKEISRVEKLKYDARHNTNKTSANAVQTLAVNNSNNRSVGGTPITLKLSFYGDFAHENGGYAGIDAQGNKLASGTIASNVYPFGTKFSFNGQTFTVRDRGGSHFNDPNRLDVFVPRNPGESDSEYSTRISNYGRKTITGYKL